MTEQTVTIINTLGIHARPASMICRAADGYKSKITLVKDGIEVNAKSTLEVMLLAAAYQTTIRIKAHGPDEKEAVAALVALFANKFNEEE